MHDNKYAINVVLYFMNMKLMVWFYHVLKSHHQYFAIDNRTINASCIFLDVFDGMSIENVHNFNIRVLTQTPESWFGHGLELVGRMGTARTALWSMVCL